MRYTIFSVIKVVLLISFITALNNCKSTSLNDSQKKFERDSPDKPNSKLNSKLNVKQNLNKSAKATLKFIFTWPMPRQYVSKEYNSSNPFSNEIHLGVDFQKENHDVKAAQGGIVIQSERMDNFGLTVIIDHGWSKTIYAYLAKSTVKKGDTVKLAEVIGLSGDNTQHSALHFEVQKNEVSTNPRKYLEK